MSTRLSRFEKAGYASPSCLVCRKRDLRVLELHHVAGAANSILLAPLCANCHAMASDDQEDFVGHLRRRDPDRRPLVLQAAFDMGIGILTAMLAANSYESSEKVFWAAIAVMFIGWAVWNLAADRHFAAKFGTGYSDGVVAAVPQ